MPVTADSPFRNVYRLSQRTFARLLREAGSPAAPEADACYVACLTARICPLFALAMFQHESSMGKAGAAKITKSWGNTRRPAFGPPAVGYLNQDTGLLYSANMLPTLPDGRYLCAYGSWLDGLTSTLARLNRPDYPIGAPYARRTAIKDIFVHPSGAVWAPAGDENNPAGYLRAVLDFMNKYNEVQVSTPFIAIAAGHHNSDSGDATEIVQTGALANALVRAARARGWRVQSLTPQDGFGQFPGGLWDVARAVSRNPAPDIFLETHTEAGPRGVFAIYPDWGDDVDADVRDILGPAIARRVAGATGLPVRGSGVMSEQDTGVGRSGSRLGIFNKTADIPGTTRLIVEYGSHTDAADLALANTPGFYDKAAAATLDAAAAYLGVPQVVALTQPPAREPGFPGALNAAGETVLNGVNFGGHATRVEEVIVRVLNEDETPPKRYERRWVGFRLDDWRERQ